MKLLQHVNLIMCISNDFCDILWYLYSYYIFTLPPGSRCLSLFLCLCLVVCSFACISRKPYGWTSPNFFMPVAYGCGSVLIWLCCDMLCTSGDLLCTSGFMEDVMFSYGGLHCTSNVFLTGESITAKTTESILTIFCSTKTIIKYTSCVALH